MHDEAGRVVAERELCAMQTCDGRRERQPESAARGMCRGISHAHERPQRRRAIHSRDAGPVISDTQ